VTSLGVVDKVGLLLRTLASTEPGGVPTSAAARAAGLNRSTTHRLLESLRDQGLVDRIDETGRWILGPETYLMGVAAASRYDATALAARHVQALAKQTEESAFFSVRRGNETVCLLGEEGSFPLRSHVLHEGIRFPLGVASAGLAVLAYLPDADRDRYLTSVDLTATYGSAHASRELAHRVELTRARGYALNPGLLVEGSWGMAVPVFGADDSPVGALTITGVERRFDEARRPELGRSLRRAAHELTSELRHG